MNDAMVCGNQHGHWGEVSSGEAALTRVRGMIKELYCVYGSGDGMNARIKYTMRPRGRWAPRTSMPDTEHGPNIRARAGQPPRHALASRAPFPPLTPSLQPPNLSS